MILKGENDEYEKCEKTIALMLVMALLFSITFIEPAHAEIDKSSTEGVTITASSTGEEGALITLTDTLKNEYTINISHQINGMIQSETYSPNGDLLNMIIQEGDELIQYNNAGRVLVRNHLSEFATNSINKNEKSPSATTWEAKTYVKSNTNVDWSNQANAASMLITTVAAIAGVGALTSVILGGINSIVS